MRDFIIDGTGNVVRVGDRVLVRSLSFGDDFGPGVMTDVVTDEVVMVVFDTDSSRLPVPRSPTRLLREDDSERVNGEPLWSWC